MKRRSFTLRLFLRLLPVLALAAAFPWYLAFWLDHGWAVTAISIVVLLSLMWWSLRRATAPVRSLLRALSGTTSSYRDGEYNFSVYWPGNDELGDLVQAHRDLGDVLREQRQGLVQRELLLDTMVQNTPVSMLLLANGGDGVQRVVFSNLAARKLLHHGWKLEGQRMQDVLETMPVELRDAIQRGGDSLFAVREEEGDEDDEQVYHLSRRNFHLNGRPHDLLLIRLLTAELRRQEVQTWKKVIRVISHELNNSLAPIASLAHSGGELVRRGKTERLEEVFATIEERARHLEGFIRGYARFAKLPQPQLQNVQWLQFLTSLQHQIPFRMEAIADDLHSRVDIAQLGQALLNLLKNAHEACSEAEPPNDDVELRLTRLPQWVRLEVLDRGKGMNEAVLQNALMPFYSTKRNGTGLGLALTREIVEAHGGRISLQNRREGGLCVAVFLPV
ncbi:MULTISPECIES: HAMP domain-containing sensor histidine kinase [Stenotrophomonas]|jgi:nitrogen fixation/metabolism regulation signal transduction histidine kinase|uniref:histidine kinase n=1 Tax=Stenotrophomonas maltophilia TaxID=40324 RepID=A0A4S2CZ19_STEMA|nr:MULTISPECIES: HAMP domain-containing sensor histidine kinase [Stenotrophomonas]MBD3827170.1 HAMP domain-containing histidine kinase [Stenotrophomonas sp.]QIO89599.1 histidine kinase [Stenotrophomonas rhizophila]TGY33915.1 HAMP domain-containing protein [Stenotrophomonas maltophilia]HBS63589.1 ATP-binding protein [Stenotrophomonas sp.]